MLNFRKMHGLGNDFVIIDARELDLSLDKARIQAIADRHRGVGCDQLILIEHSQNWKEAYFMRVFNPDGSEAGACGNGTRCVADILMTEDDVDHVIIETAVGALNCWRADGGLIGVEMGVPRLGWRDIPLAEETDTDHLPLDGDPVAVNIGNPHCVFFVDDVDLIDLEAMGPHIENHPLFPERSNVEFVHILAPDHIRMRVWERGAGITQACGSGACAATVSAIRRGLTERKVTVTLDGGDLLIDWPADDAPVSMTGPVSHVFDGELDLAEI